MDAKKQEEIERMRKEMREIEITIKVNKEVIYELQRDIEALHQRLRSYRIEVG